MSAKTPPESRNLTDPAPRQVDIFTMATILFGGFTQQFGWVFFTLGSLFAWVFVPASEARFWLEPKTGWLEAPAAITSFQATNASVNDQTVYWYTYSFDVNGQIYTGKSYSMGKPYEVGDEAIVKYRGNAPEVSHIQGANRAIFPSFVLFVLIFPLAGLGMIIGSLRYNLRAIRLLQIGAFTRGKMVGKEDTGSYIQINNTTYPVYKYYFEFSTGGRAFTANCKTHQSWKVEDEEQEIILYDKFTPDFNVVFDAAPNMPAISRRGTLELASPTKALYLILPILGIGLNAYFFWNGSPLGLN
jgi:hypothetical protein